MMSDSLGEVGNTNSDFLLTPKRNAGGQAVTFVPSVHMWEITASPNSEQESSVAPSISRSKS